MYDRWLAGTLEAKLRRPYVHLLFGARQTGKSTLLNALVPDEALRINLADPQERSRHLAHPGDFAQACRSLPARQKGQFVFVDEAQSVPSIFDAV
jgi:predicted AAA+ superfamily ATPase